jgi:hypothetical protein
VAPHQRTMSPHAPRLTPPTIPRSTFGPSTLCSTLFAALVDPNNLNRLAGFAGTDSLLTVLGTHGQCRLDADVGGSGPAHADVPVAPMPPVPGIVVISPSTLETGLPPAPKPKTAAARASILPVHPNCVRACIANRVTSQYFPCVFTLSMYQISPPRVLVCMLTGGLNSKVPKSRHDEILIYTRITTLFYACLRLPAFFKDLAFAMRWFKSTTQFAGSPSTHHYFTTSTPFPVVCTDVPNQVMSLLVVVLARVP